MTLKTNKVQALYSDSTSCRGAAHSYMQELQVRYHAELIVACTDLSDEDAQSIMVEFERGKGHLMAVLTEKLKQWDVMPWQIAALGQKDADKARQVAATILRNFDLSAVAMEGHRAAHHPLTWKWLVAGSPVRMDIQQFIGGAGLHQLPALQQIIGEMRLLPTVTKD